MKLTITHKLILAFTALTLLILIATLVLARWSFERGFLDYVNAIEKTRLEQISNELSEEYVKAGSNWDSMTSEHFNEVVHHAMRGLRDNIEARSPHHMGQPPSPDHRRGHRRGPPTALFNENGRHIAGSKIVSTDISNENIKHITTPIYIDNKIVGELRSNLRRIFNTPQETAFSKQQLKTSWIIGIISLLLAIMISMFLAKGLLAPIRRMINNVGQLSDGDYSVRLNEKRTDELGQLMSDFDHLAMKLEENQTSRRRWLAEISHELRTPLTVLTGEIEALKDGLRKFDKDQLDSLQQETLRLNYLVDDLYELSLSDIGGLRYEFTKTDLKSCLDTTFENIQHKLDNQSIDLVIKSDTVWVNADTKRINQLLTNLLNNALAYTDAPGRIEVTLLNMGKFAVIEINDTPPGVDELACEQLFEPLFRQEASRSRRTGGAGLGLSICRNIVKAHNGKISALPSALGGLCIRIELPVVNQV